MDTVAELDGLHRLLKAMKKPGLRLTRDGRDVKPAEIETVERDISRLEAVLARAKPPND
jgi:hypothetical protein